MKTNTVHRRQVLRGAGGVTLALPLLPSLLPRAYGDTAIARPRRFIAITTEHGGITAENMYPDPATAAQTLEIFPGHEIRYGRLARTVDGLDGVLSPVLRGRASLLTDRIAGKMNVLRGLDIPFYIAHHAGGHLGNYAPNLGAGDPTKLTVNPPIPTIDQIMAWSRAFYPDLSSIKERSVQTGNRGSISWGWSNPTARAGSVQRMETVSSGGDLFNRFFLARKVASAPTRRPVVDIVLESYKNLRDGSRRLSVNDKQRLTDHMDRLSELQRRLTVVRDCSGAQKPAASTTEGDGLTRARALYAGVVDVVAAAITCDLTRIVTIGVGNTFSAFTGDWHQDIAHKSRSSPMSQQILATAYKDTFESVFLALASKLDVEEAQGRSYLDASLIAWSQESGGWTHDSDSIPIVTAGAAGGYLKTGNHIDYRNLSLATRIRESDGTYKPGRTTGLTYNRWLATALHAMGVPRAEWERPDAFGYGNNIMDTRYRGRYVAGAVESAYDPLPLLKA